MNPPPDPQSLFVTLCQRLAVQPDRHGEAHVACPWCGKEPARGQVHFSFGEKGGHCFVCGKSAGLVALADRWGTATSPATPTPVYHPDRRAARVVRTDWAGLADQFACNPDRFTAWAAYKPLAEPLIRAHRLGLGTFPKYLSKCAHQRLMVPLYERGKCVGIRGRSISCQCGKWLSPAGSKCVLYNANHLARAAGRVVMIVENPIDALLLEQMHEGVIAVATLGVSMWQADWTPIVAQCGARQVIVAYDNDRPGNGGGERGRLAWLETHATDIVPNGIRLVNALLAAGAPARLYDWGDAPLKTDVGDLLKEVA